MSYYRQPPAQQRRANTYQTNPWQATYGRDDESEEEEDSSSEDGGQDAPMWRYFTPHPADKGRDTFSDDDDNGGILNKIGGGADGESLLGFSIKELEIILMIVFFALLLVSVVAYNKEKQFSECTANRCTLQDCKNLYREFRRAGAREGW
ncbi:hypothetical protein QBC47DRAFT_396250 [Echria macrotheca]|uniref:Uncharacterized protein n=1 Tax=Echria macrotheca TaxID=438768 RepID=A0AAJ0BL37_9PEZI|nr:hypothetical protein QBC47DRAFT_396250 [Echria macrotheca]